MNTNNQYFGYTRKEMLDFMPDDVRISLEVGCGSGKFSALLKEKGMECWGIEPEKNAYEKSVGRLDRSFHGVFEETFRQLPSSYFDAIIFNDVLEHMVDPWQVLQQSKSLLRNRGCIVASLPNILYFPEFFRFVMQKNLRYADAGTFDRTHLRFFTKASIIDMFNQTGFTIEKVAGIHPYVSTRFTLFNLGTFGYFHEMKFMQFGVRARIR